MVDDVVRMNDMKRKSIAYWLNGAVLAVSFSLSIYFWADYIARYKSVLEFWQVWFLYALLTYTIILVGRFAIRVGRASR